MMLALLAAAALQAASLPPPGRRPEGPRGGGMSLDTAAADDATPRLLAAQGMSAQGVAVIQAEARPIDAAPLAAAQRRIATTAAVVPLDLPTLRLALEVRDSIAAGLARARSARTMAILDKLSPSDRAVFLRVYGVGAEPRGPGGPPPGARRPR